MNAFQTMIVRAKETFVSAYHFVSGKISAAANYIRGTKTYQTVVTNADKVKSNPTAQKAFGSFGTLMRSFGRTYGFFIIVTAVINFVMNPKSITLLWKDWRNNHRRLVALLWAALMTTVAYYYYVLLFKFFFLAMLTVTVGVVMFSLFHDLYIQVRYGSDEAQVRTSRTFAPARFAVRWLIMFVWVFPLRIVNYTPQRIARFIKARNYNKTSWERSYIGRKFQTDSTKVETVTEEKETVFDSSAQSEPVTEHVTEKLYKVTIDAELFQANPKRSGEDLARLLLEEGDMEAVREYRDKHLRVELQRAGLTSKQIVLAMRGYEEIMKVKV